MSTRIYKSIALPQGYKAQPPTLTAAIGAAIVDLEDKVKARGLRPLWDTIEIQITGSVSVLAVDPREVAA